MVKKFKKFCCICGKITDELIDNRCYSCYLKENPPEIPERIELRVCKTCYRIYHKGKWEYISNFLPDILAYGAIEALHKKGFEVENFDILEFYENEGKILSKIKIRGMVGEVSFEKEEEIVVKARFEQCIDCSRRAGGYYEAILQIRGSYDEDKIYSIVEENLQNSFVSKIKKLREGIDFYISSQKVAKRIARILKNKYNAEVIVSPTLVGKKDGKDLYRFSISVRLGEGKWKQKKNSRK